MTEVVTKVMENPLVQLALSPVRANMPRKVTIAFWLIVLLTSAFVLSCQPKPQAESAPVPTPTPAPQPTSMMYPPGFGPAVPDKPYPGTGVVTIVNQKEGWVEIEHEQIKDLMPKMLMEFWIRDRSIMKGIQVGDKVEFVVVEDSKGQYLTELKRVSTSP